MIKGLKMFDCVGKYRQSRGHAGPFCGEICNFGRFFAIERRNSSGMSTRVALTTDCDDSRNTLYIQASQHTPQHGLSGTSMDMPLLSGAPIATTKRPGSSSTSIDVGLGTVVALPRHL